MRRAGLVVLMALLALLPLAYAAWQLMEAARVGALVPIDLDLYRGATLRWLSGGPFYEPWQLVGPYDVRQGAILYPPIALLLFVPFTVLPPVLWWAFPLGATAWALWRLRPGPLAWPLLAACVAWPPTIALIVHGNPGMWAMAAVALAVLYRWPAVLVFVKPSLAPFAFIGMRDRRWWMALAVVAVLGALLGAMWADWVRVIVNARGAGVLYSWMEVPMILIGVIAWVGREAAAEPRRRPPVLSSRS
ncbi:MAG TPA: glycosyltransferase 87 family protein [Candidatus Limnocylindrales bacterium]